MGALEAFAGQATAIGLAKFIATVYISAIRKGHATPLDIFIEFKSRLAAMLSTMELMVLGPPLPPSFKAGFAFGLVLGDNLTSDPPVDGFFLSPQPHPDLQDLSGNGPLAIGVVHDPLFHLQRNGAEVPTVHRLGIRNLTSTTPDLSHSVGQYRSGLCPSGIQWTKLPCPAGETAEVGLALRPVCMIGAPGSGASILVMVTPVANEADAVVGKCQLRRSRDSRRDDLCPAQRSPRLTRSIGDGAIECHIDRQRVAGTSR